jgi:hypothetical protein
MERMSLGGELVLASACLTVTPLITDDPEHTHTPFGKYKYLRLLMGLKCSPDIAQAAMENILSEIKDANVYIDVVGAFSNDWDHHVNLLATILWQLRENGFTINPLMCEWPLWKLTG